MKREKNQGRTVFYGTPCLSPICFVRSSAGGIDRVEGLTRDLHKVPAERRIADVASFDEAQLHARAVRHREREFHRVFRENGDGPCSTASQSGDSQAAQGSNTKSK